MPAVKRASKKHSRRMSKAKTSGKKQSKRSTKRSLKGGAKRMSKRRVSRKTIRKSSKKRTLKGGEYDPKKGYDPVKYPFMPSEMSYAEHMVMVAKMTAKEIIDRAAATIGSDAVRKALLIDDAEQVEKRAQGYSATDDSAEVILTRKKADEKLAAMLRAAAGLIKTTALTADEKRLVEIRIAERRAEGRGALKGFD